ncbi:MAG: hypothetical protein PHV34_16240 [Verrucomicrobiae bacterium]|nr:hypothetical protein [Verrucomicrobiae bacterium]
MKLRRYAKTTLTAVEMLHGETLEFYLLDGRKTTIELVATAAEIKHTTLKTPGLGEPAARTVYRFWADIRVNGQPHRLEREVGTQASFYEPWTIGGVNIWLDAVDAIFEFVQETHGRCRLQENCVCYLPQRRHARFAVQDATLRICPEIVHPWCPLPPEGLRIEECYRGEDCWMGAFDGVSAHAGLDINHPKGTPLHAPIDLDDQFLYHSTEFGDNCNRWRGIRMWADGSLWVLASSHMSRLTIQEHTPLRQGQQYAEAAGVYVGAAEHSHFGFSIVDHGELILLDPWILFWQMYQDQGRKRADGRKLTDSSNSTNRGGSCGAKPRPRDSMTRWGIRIW